MGEHSEMFLELQSDQIAEHPDTSLEVPWGWMEEQHDLVREVRSDQTEVSFESLHLIQ